MASLGRVLVVEDEPQVALVLHDALQEFGYQVRVSVDGHEALNQVATFRPHVILLDLWLPGLPGESVLERVRSEAPAVPVVIVSGNNDVDLARALLARGAFDYVMKPFDLAVVERITAAAVTEYERRTGAEGPG